MSLGEERFLDLRASKGAQELDAKDHVRDQIQIGIEKAVHRGAPGLGENDLRDGRSVDIDERSAQNSSSSRIS